MIRLLIILSLVLPWPHSHTVNVPNLNSGGCGWYAYYLSAKYPDGEIVILRGGRHVMVYHNGFYLDSRGAWLPPAVWCYSFGDIQPITRSELRVLLNDRSLWNPAFNLNDTLKLKNI